MNIIALAVAVVVDGTAAVAVHSVAVLAPASGVAVGARATAAR